MLKHYSSIFDLSKWLLMGVGGRGVHSSNFGAPNEFFSQVSFFFSCNTRNLIEGNPTTV